MVRRSAKRKAPDHACPRTFAEVNPGAREGTDYLSTLADHSQQPTGSPSMSTLPPSKS